jgi:lauroyl/myristoyl acyltransferase
VSEPTLIAPPAHKLVQARDVYRVPLWIGTKLLYAVAPVPVLFRLARAKGTVRWFNPRRRERVLARMERFYGETRTEAEVCRIANRHLEYTRMREFATLWPQIRGFTGNERCRIDGLEHVDAALAAGQGAILVTMHFGYGRLIKPLLEARGYQAWVVGNTQREFARPSGFTRLGLFVYAQVLHLPQVSRPHPADLQAGINLRPLLAALARNEILILPLDSPGGHGWGRDGSLRPMRVLGQEVLFAPGAMSLARRTGVPMLPAFVVDADGADPIGIRLEIGAPLSLQVTDSARADVQANLERFVSVFERYLERYPHLFRCTTTGTSEGLALGERVKVKGRLEPNGSFCAFMVEIRPKVERSRLKGKIEAIDEERRALRLLGRELALPAACELSDSAGLPISFADLSVGQIVKLTGHERGLDLVPTSLRLAVPRGNDLAELHGVVEQLSPDRRSFQVLGFSVTTSETTKVKDRTGRLRGRAARV